AEGPGSSYSSVFVPLYGRLQVASICRCQRHLSVIFCAYRPRLSTFPGERQLLDSPSPVMPPRFPTLPERFLPPPGFVWGNFSAPDGATLRWGHLPVESASAECVMVGGFGEFIEKQFETVRHLAARGIAVW